MDAAVSRVRPAAFGARGYAAAALGLVAATIAGALVFQAAGYAPCELCLKERLPYYAGLVLAAVTLFAVWRGPWRLAQVGFVLLALLFLFSAAFGAYHAGIEWRLWPGPSDCTGSLTRAKTNTDFLQQLQTVRVVRCDAVAIRILGLSLAGWNAVISLVVAIIALAGAGRARSGGAAWAR